MVRKLSITFILAGAISIAGATAAFAAPNPSGTGQPNASCEESTTHPPGIDGPGFANAETHYAGEGDGSLHANSPHAVSQYDVACYQLSSH